MNENTVSLADALRAGDRRALSRAITLAESTRADHREAAEALIQEVLPATGKAVRLGISGVPGVGKSTFIEAFGLHVIDQGHRIAVLAVDPSSKRSGGSILGDKTRMRDLARHAQAFIRPSPAGETLGGVARRSRDALLLCEAAGFDVIAVETVGVGQSETAVADMTDLFLLLLLPTAGDELQGIKRGIMELADLVAINKADGPLLPLAQQAAAEYRNALRLLRPPTNGGTPEVLTCSAVDGSGIADIWQAIEAEHRRVAAAGDLAARRARQAVAWMWQEISDGLIARLRADPAAAAELEALASEVESGRMAPGAAARRVLARFGGRE